MLTVDDLKNEVMRALGTTVVRASVAFGELTIFVPRSRVAEVLEKLRDDSAIVMSQLMDICGADYPERPERFEIVYQLLSLMHNVRLRVKVHAGENDLVPSATGVFPSAGWFEREVWDMIGVPFSGHPDLRRILTDYGFEGHPLRKDFPLTGFVQMRYDPEQKRVVYEPLKLQQDFRSFDFLSPWSGMTDVQRRRRDTCEEGEL